MPTGTLAWELSYAADAAVKRKKKKKKERKNLPLGNLQFDKRGI